MWDHWTKAVTSASFRTWWAFAKVETPNWLYKVIGGTNSLNTIYSCIRTLKLCNRVCKWKRAKRWTKEIVYIYNWSKGLWRWWWYYDWCVWLTRTLFKLRLTLKGIVYLFRPISIAIRKQTLFRHIIDEWHTLWMYVLNSIMYAFEIALFRLVQY